MEALLALEDGRIFRGESFGATGTMAGEICFNTSMTGYQEVLTDPSYRGQIVAMTYPLIGNYGINFLDLESEVPQVRDSSLRKLSPVASNWRKQGTLEEYLLKHGVPGIQGIDTRALTRHLRTRGALRACITTELSEEKAIEAAKAVPYEGVDFVKEVSPEKPYDSGSGEQAQPLVEGGEQP